MRRSEKDGSNLYSLNLTFRNPGVGLTGSRSPAGWSSGTRVAARLVRSVPAGRGPATPGGGGGGGQSLRLNSI